MPYVPAFVSVRPFVFACGPDFIILGVGSSLLCVAEKQVRISSGADSSLHCVAFGMTVRLLECVGGGEGGGSAAAFSSPYMTTQATVIPTGGRNLSIGSTSHSSLK